VTLTGRLRLLVGVLAVVFGLVLTVEPSLVPEVDLATALVLSVWALALGQFTVAAIRWLGDQERTQSLPDVDTRQEYPPPAADLDEALAAAKPGAHHAQTRTEVRDHLRSVAVETLARSSGQSRERAAASLDAGEWTDDADAAALFETRGDDEDVGHARPSFRRRVRAAVARLRDRSGVDEDP
jgi:hypothetical protein